MVIKNALFFAVVLKNKNDKKTWKQASKQASKKERKKESKNKLSEPLYLRQLVPNIG